MAPRELEGEPGVDRPEDRAPRRVDVLEQPLDLRAGEVRVDDQAGSLAHELLVAPLAQLVTASGGAPVLPDQGVVDGLSRPRVPRDDGLALVGDPDAVEIGPLDAGIAERLPGHRARDLPDLGGVVLDPAGPREVLRELRVGPPRDPPLAIEDQAHGAGRALVDCEDQPNCGGFAA